MPKFMKINENLKKTFFQKIYRIKKFFSDFKILQNNYEIEKFLSTLFQIKSMKNLKTFSKNLFGMKNFFQILKDLRFYKI